MDEWLNLSEQKRVNLSERHRTLENRCKALKGLLGELVQNPDLWKQKQKLESSMDSLEEKGC